MDSERSVVYGKHVGIKGSVMLTPFEQKIMKVLMYFFMIAIMSILVTGFLGLSILKYTAVAGVIAGGLIFLYLGIMLFKYRKVLFKKENVYSFTGAKGQYVEIRMDKNDDSVDVFKD